MAEKLTNRISSNRSRLPRVVEIFYRGLQKKISVRGRVEIGSRLRLGRDSLVSSFHGLQIGSDVSIGPGSVVEADGVIGDFCLIGRNVQIVGREDHAIDELGLPMVFASWVGDRAMAPRDRVSIGDDVWIGAGAIVLGGVSIGHGAIVGAGAVVASDIEPFGIAIGNPARVVKLRFADSESRDRHLLLLSQLKKKRL